MSRCLVILDDLCFPTNSGGRYLAWQDSLALTDLYDEADAIVFHHASDVPTPDSYRPVFTNIHFVARKSFPASTARNPLTPYQASSRKLSREDVATVGSWAPPEVIVAHHEWTADALRAVGQAFPNSLRVLRSHNHEGRFLRSLENDARGLRKLYLKLERTRTSAAFLKHAADQAHEVWVLADEDQDAYAGISGTTRLIPPSIDMESDVGSAGTNSEPRIGFLGALDMPQAVAGLSWFLEEVWPLVQEQCPHSVLSIAGRRAEPTFAQRLEATRGVEFLGEVPSSRNFIETLRVFINPVFSGSGVNIKMLEPAAMGVPVVSTRVGLRGLADISSALGGFDRPDDFAAACVRFLADRALAEEYGQKARAGISALARSSVSGLMDLAIENHRISAISAS